MKEYAQIIKNWYKLAKPNKMWTFISFFMVILVNICLIIAPIFAAKLTLALTGGKYNMAIVYLIIVFLFLFLRKTFWHVNYLCYSRIIGSIYVKINNEFINKGLNAKLKNYKETPKERILNIIHTDVFTISDFADKLARASARFVMILVSITIIFTVNVWAGLIVIVADIIDFFVLSWINKRRANYLKKMRYNHDAQYEMFSEIVDTRETIKDLGIENRVKKDYNKVIDDYIRNLHGRTFWDSLKDSYFPTFYSFLILLATILLVVFVSKGALELELYFVIVSYITNGIENTNNIYTLLPDLRATNIAYNRVNTVLNFVEKDEIAFGTNNLKDVMGSINFRHVSYKRDDEGNPSLNDFDVMFKENETSLIIGPRSCGKRTVLNLLRRSIKPDKGEIFLDGVNIVDYNPTSYRDNFNYITTKPTFFKGSIMKNLVIVEKNRKIIFEVCKEVGVYDYIDSLPRKFNTDISTLSYEKLYLLGLVRAILSATEVLVLYEFPQNLTNTEKENVLRLLEKMHGTRTIIIFSAQDYCSAISDKIIYVERGSIKSIQFNDKSEE